MAETSDDTDHDRHSVTRGILGLHHITRPEDWPVMPVDMVSFFDRKPALDVPPTVNGHCHNPGGG